MDPQHQDQIRRFLTQAEGRLAHRWQQDGITWEVTLAHTHGDVVAFAVWNDAHGYIGYREYLAEEFLQQLCIVPREPLWQRLRRFVRDLPLRFR